MPNGRDIGLVLSGGGAKGAFQAGVWKAICELGLAERVRAISGTSVGAINGAAFATLRDPEKICRFWRERIDEVATPNLRNLSIDALRHGIENTLAGRAFPFHGLLDRDALESILSSLLPTTWPEDAPTVIASTLECRAAVLGELDASAYHLRRFRIDEEPDHDRRIAKILASASIPWGFDPVEIDGKRYVDGGWDENGGENIPVTPLRKKDSRVGILVVVRCNSAEVEPRPLRGRIPAGMKVVEVRPSETLPGLFGDVAELLATAGELSKLLIPLGNPLDGMVRKMLEKQMGKAQSDGNTGLASSIMVALSAFPDEANDGGAPEVAKVFVARNRRLSQINDNLANSVLTSAKTLFVRLEGEKKEWAKKGESDIAKNIADFQRELSAWVKEVKAKVSSTAPTMVEPTSQP